MKWNKLSLECIESNVWNEDRPGETWPLFPCQGRSTDQASTLRRVSLRTAPRCYKKYFRVVVQPFHISWEDNSTDPTCAKRHKQYFFVVVLRGVPKRCSECFSVSIPPSVRKAKPLCLTWKKWSSLITSILWVLLLLICNKLWGSPYAHLWSA